MHRGERAFRFTRARLVVALLALFSFSVQTYVVETHVHVPVVHVPVVHVPGSPAQAVVQLPHKAQGTNQDHNKGDKDSPADCPICQAFALTGAFLKPLVVLFLLSLACVAAAPFLQAGESRDPFFARQGLSRAPPGR